MLMTAGILNKSPLAPLYKRGEYWRVPLYKRGNIGESPFHKGRPACLAFRSIGGRFLEILLARCIKNVTAERTNRRIMPTLLRLYSLELLDRPSNTASRHAMSESICSSLIISGGINRRI